MFFICWLFFWLTKTRVARTRYDTGTWYSYSCQYVVRIRDTMVLVRSAVRVLAHMTRLGQLGEMAAKLPEALVVSVQANFGTLCTTTHSGPAAGRRRQAAYRKDPAACRHFWNAVSKLWPP